MKKILMLAMLFVSLSFYGQSIFLSGKTYIAHHTSDLFEEENKSSVYVIVTINKDKKTVNFSVNGDNQNHTIESSNITSGGKAIKFMLSDGMQMTIGSMSNIDVVMFPWDPSKGIVGGIMVRLTNDDKKLLGLIRS